MKRIALALSLCSITTLFSVGCRKGNQASAPEVGDNLATSTVVVDLLRLPNHIVKLPAHHGLLLRGGPLDTPCPNINLSSEEKAGVDVRKVPVGSKRCILLIRTDELEIEGNVRIGDVTVKYEFQ